jgi:hypothetical protein
MYNGGIVPAYLYIPSLELLDEFHSNHYTTRGLNLP